MKNHTWQDILTNKNKIDEIEFAKRFSIRFNALFSRISNDRELHTVVTVNNLFVQSIMSSIPSLLGELDIKIKTFQDYCHTCIITDEEVDLMSESLHCKWLFQKTKEGFSEVKSSSKYDFEMRLFKELSNSNKRFYREIIYCIPVALQALGYSLYKPTDKKFFSENELNEIAKTLHSRYNLLYKNPQIQEETKNAYLNTNLTDEIYFSSDYEKLEQKVKASNIDSAYHFATKLLSLGYKIEAAKDDSEIIELHLDDTKIETMAKLEHERWCWEKRLNGFIYGTDEKRFSNRLLVPYEELTESDKQKIRNQVSYYPVILKDMKYNIIPVDPAYLDLLSYQQRTKSIAEKAMIHVEETINGLQELKLIYDTKDHNPKLINTKNELNAINNAFSSSMKFQRSVLPSKKNLRNALPESFILNKPQNLVSGDFYFIAKVDATIIFAVGDCSGFSFESAMMTMLCSCYLDLAVYEEKLKDPAEIIRYVFVGLNSFFKRSGNSLRDNHFMDIALCAKDINTNVVKFAGISSPVFHVHNELIIQINGVDLKNNYADPLDIVQKPDFISQEIPVTEGDLLYLSTDGFYNQISGNKNRNVSLGKFSDILSEINLLPLAFQQDRLNTVFETWKSQSDNSQTDDVLIMGIKF